MITLMADQETVSAVLDRPPDQFVEYLVLAHIDTIAPLIPELKSCQGKDCTGVILDSNSLTRHLSGKAIAIESEH